MNEQTPSWLVDIYEGLASDYLAAARSEAARVAALSDSFSVREIEWRVAEEQEEKELQLKQFRRRIQNRTGSSDMTVETFDAVQVAVVGGLVLTEQLSRTSRPQDGGTVPVKPHTSFLVGACDTNPFSESTYRSDPALYGFYLPDVSKLPALLLRFPSVLFDTSIALGLLADGRRISFEQVSVHPLRSGAFSNKFDNPFDV